MKITLEPIESVNPSTYNPRSADPARLDLIELSLCKLGFIAPIFADADGEILSGHQRHLVATRMGATHVPVFRTKALDLDQRKTLNIAFRLDYEPGIRIGDFQDKPKVQKYHTEAEFRDLFGPFFRSVKVRDFSNNINATCSSARPVDPARLREAIEFEFGLPYPDGTRMDLVKCAMDSFSQRLQTTLSK